MAIIKPSRDSDFHTLVKLLDEMAINSVNYYAMVDMDSIEYSMMQQW